MMSVNDYEVFLENLKKSKQIVGYTMTPPRKVLWRDIYKNRNERIQAILLYRRTRRTVWDRLSLFEYLEFGHLLKMQLWGINGNLDGHLELETPIGKYDFGFSFTPVMPVEYIQISLKITNNNAIFDIESETL